LLLVRRGIIISYRIPRIGSSVSPELWKWGVMSEVFSVASAESEQQTYAHHPLSKVLERRAEMQLFPQTRHQ
jgi:hypothetical protein